MQKKRHSPLSVGRDAEQSGMHESECLDSNPISSSEKEEINRGKQKNFITDPILRGIEFRRHSERDERSDSRLLEQWRDGGGRQRKYKCDSHDVPSYYISEASESESL